MIAIMSLCYQDGHIFLKHLARVDASTEFPENAYGGQNLTESKITAHPTPPFWKWQKKHIKKLEKEMLSQSAVLLTRHLNIHSVGSLNILMELLT